MPTHQDGKNKPKPATTNKAKPKSKPKK